MRSILSTIFSILAVSLFAQDEWSITVDPDAGESYFGVTMANGMVGLVSSPEPFKVKEVVLNGAFDTYGRGRVSNIMQVFNTANVEFTNPKFTEEEKNAYKELFSNPISHKQTINFRYGEFTSTVSYEAMDITYTLRALRHLPFTNMVQVEVKAKKEVELAPASVMTAPEVLRDLGNYFTTVDVPGREQIPMMTSTAQSPTGKLEVAAAVSIIIEGEEHPHLIHQELNYNDHKVKFYKKLKKGESLKFTTFGSVVTSEHFADPRNEAERLTLYAFLEGVDRNIERHRKAWDKLWMSGDIEITGSKALTRDIRFALYHLYSFARSGTAYSMSPMGLSGLGYNGHVFWDTELWMYPPLLMLQPDIAKSLLEYRFERLNEAKKNAFSHGYEGAMFPWESDQDGQEATPIWALTGPFEHHITGDIGWACWKYYQVTKDKEWLASRGYPIMKEVADFWVSRTDENADGSLSINNVVGADEYAEGVNDNAFTNGVAKVALRYATLAAKELGKSADPSWDETAEKIRLLKFEGGVTQEYDGYAGETIKQADVNLLSYPLDLIRDEDAIERDIAYYESKYDVGGPAMGFAILSILNNWIGNKDKAMKYFKQGYQPNLVPPFGVISEMAGGSNPYFATGAGGMLQNVMAGFGGLEITDNGVERTQELPLPNGWGTLIIRGVGRDDQTFEIGN